MLATGCNTVAKRDVYQDGGIEVFLRSGGADRLQRELDAVIARLAGGGT